MENTNRDIVYDAVPQDDWRNAESTSHRNIIEDNEEYTIYEALDENDAPIYAQQNLDDPDPDDEDEDDEDDDEDEDRKDWGHIDPAEGNSPIPDPMDPSGPGSAV